MNRKITIACIVIILLLSSPSISTITNTEISNYTIEPKVSGCDCKEKEDNIYFETENHVTNKILTTDYEIQQIQQAIEEKNANWIAGHTSVSDLSDYEKQMRLGLMIPDEQTNTNPCENTMMLSYGDLPRKWDWRNVSGKNYMTPVKNQGSCGSCWAFGTIGTIEAMMKIQSNNSDWNPDFSEQDLVSCSGTGDCDHGGWPKSALNYINNTGVVDEGCFPYQADDISCYEKCDDWKDRRTYILQWGSVEGGIENIKQALVNHGPLITGIYVTGDFLYYTSGVYTPVLEDNTINYGIEPNHCVVLVGYNDAKRYWICKNSWGPGWGENGYMNIQYGSNFIEDEKYPPLWAAVKIDVSLNLVTPNGGEEFFGGEICDISWTSINTTGKNIEIRYSTDDGESYPNLITTVSVDTGSYSWNIPQGIDCITCKIIIKIIDLTSLDICDASDNSFSVTPIFTEKNPEIIGVSDGSFAWGDIDNDDDLDLAIAGKNSSTLTTKIYKNNNGIFKPLKVNLLGVSQCSLAWGDYDNDGYLDLALAGHDGTKGSSKIYHNNNGLDFQPINENLIGVYDCYLTWGDFNDDNYLDLAIAGKNDSGPVTKIYKNDGHGTFTQIDTNLIGVYDCSLEWGDFNNDKKLDIVIAGNSERGIVAEIYQNNGDETFTPIDTDLKGLCDSSIISKDYDNDGYLDLVIAGTTNFKEPKSKTLQIKQRGIIARLIEFIKKILKFLFGDDEENNYYQVTKIYQNNGNGDFVDINAKLSGTSHCSLAWSNYNKDEKQDLFTIGKSGSKTTIKIYQNNGNKEFKIINTQSLGYSNSAVSWIDYDNDGDLDFILSGNSGGYITKIYENNIY